MASVIGRGQRTFEFLLDLLYPPRCGGCGKYGEGWWCAACDNRTQWLNARDSRVSLELPSGQSLAVISAANFGSPLREGIHCFKYEGQPQLAEAFAAHMSAIAQANALSADGIVPVPLHATRLKERGFNQSLLLARYISAALGRPVEARALQRIRPTQQQAHLSATARKENMCGAFAALPERVKGRALMLVDDVLTTGATLVECAHVLYEAGAQHVVALTLARASS